jgi:hypothetical protein
MHATPRGAAISMPRAVPLRNPPLASICALGLSAKALGIQELRRLGHDDYAGGERVFDPTGKVRPGRRLLSTCVDNGARPSE